jgi:thiamine monophosphate synthase
MVEAHGADFAVLAPIFEKAGDRSKPLGVEALRAAAERPRAAAQAMPVLALGGVTLQNAAECIRAGAAGVAGIRVFQTGDLKETVACLRAISSSQIPGVSKAKHPYWPA